MTTFFDGVSSGKRTLWVTNGTSGTTVKFGSVTFSNATNFTPDFTQEFVRQYYFSDGTNLWETDGTVAGTLELAPSGIFSGIADPYITIFDNNDGFGIFNAYNGMVLYDGASGGKDNLWVEGSAVTLTNQSPSGLDPQFITVFNDEVLFSGIDASNISGLWAYNGTAGAEITPAAGTAEPSGLHVFDIFTFGNIALFEGTNKNSQQGLWVTNGLSGAGNTFELTGITNANANGIFEMNQNDPDFTFYDGEVLFAGTDKNGNLSLWETNGTASGTQEITSFPSEPFPVTGTDFIVYNNVVIFRAGYDLWVTNGTAAGTSELFQNMFSNGATGVNPGFALADGEVLFLGEGNSMDPELWETDGTKAGTQEIPVSDNSGLDPIGLTSETLTPDDFNDDGKPDMLWRSTSANGYALYEWQMSGSTITSSPALTLGGVPQTPDSTWSIAGIGNFYDGNNADILWKQGGNNLQEWVMDGSTILASVDPTSQGNPILPDASWNVAGIGDFNGAGNDEILWRDTNTALAIWAMQGTAILGSTAPETLGGTIVSPPSTWSVAGIGDFNGDGKADILWRDGAADLQEWEMDGSTILSSATPTNIQGVSVIPDTTWSVLGVGDFNGDGNADILWQQSGSNRLQIWFMNGSTIMSTAAPTQQGTLVQPDSTWSVLEVGTFNGTPASDIIWQQSTTGLVEEWSMDGSLIVGSPAVTTGGLSVAPSPTFSSQAKPTDFS